MNHELVNCSIAIIVTGFEVPSIKNHVCNANLINLSWWGLPLCLGDKGPQASPMQHNCYPKRIKIGR